MVDIITIANTEGVLPQEVNYLLRIEAQAVVITVGVLHVAQPLASERTAKLIALGGTEGEEVRRPARSALDQVGNREHVRISRRVRKVVMAPCKRGVEQPCRDERSVIADSNVTRAVLQFVKRRGIRGCETSSVEVIVTVGRITKN